MEEEG